MTELEFNKEQLKYIEKSVKRNKKLNIFLYIWFIICLIGFCYYGFKIFSYTIVASDKEFTIWGNILCFTCWIYNSTFSLKNFKKNKKSLEENTIEYNELLKKVDHSRFLREQRKIKMKKIKKRIL